MRDSGIRLTGSALGIALAVLALAYAARLAASAQQQVGVPFSLGPAESSNLETIQVIRAGLNPYDRAVYAEPPLVFTGYTPLYHYAVALLPVPDANPFLYGRIVAAAAMALAALLPFAVPGRGGRAVPWVAAGVFLASAPVVQRMVFLRNDSLGLLLAALAVVVGQRAAGRPRWIVAAAALCIAALFTKQPFVSAPIALALSLLASDRAAFRRFAVAGAALGALAAGLAQLGWGSDFWFCTLIAPQHPMYWGQFVAMGLHVLRQPLFVGLVLGVAGLTALAFMRRPWRETATNPYFLYAGVSLLLALATVGKLGSGPNYFVEPILALLLWATALLRRAPGRDLARLAAAALLVGSATLELLWNERPGFPIAAPAAAAEREQEIAQVRRDVAALGGESPTVMGLYEHPGLYRESDRVQLSFPLFYLWLWSAGHLDVQDMVGLVERKAFDVIVLPEKIVPGHWVDPFRRPIVEAVFARYRRAGEGSGNHYYVPR